MSAERLAEIRALAQAATPGPWEVGWISEYRGIRGVVSRTIVGGVDGEHGGVAITGDQEYIEHPNADANAAYLAALDPSTVLALLARLDAAERALEAARDSLARCEMFQRGYYTCDDKTDVLAQIDTVLTRPPTGGADGK